MFYSVIDAIVSTVINIIVFVKALLADVWVVLVETVAFVTDTFGFHIDNVERFVGGSLIMLGLIILVKLLPDDPVRTVVRLFKPKKKEIKRWK